MRIYLSVAVAISSLAGVALGARRDWTGSAACGACHPAELAGWQATPHARTRERFATRPEGRCLGCHSTGEAPAGPAIAVEVGCEACHGAGAAYAETDLMRNRPVALALGLTDVSTPEARAALCARCHRRATRATPFDVRSDGAGRLPRGIDATAPVHPKPSHGPQ